MKVSVAGIEIDNLTKQEVLAEVDKNVHMDKNVYYVTPYSEMVVFALRDEEYRRVLNNSALSLADGIGILWAAKYLHTDNSLLGSLLAIIFNPRSLRKVIREQISGSRLVFDLARLAQEKNYSLSLVGGQGNVAAQASQELKKRFPNLNIKLALSDRSFDDRIVSEINENSSDILLIAYSPPKQEFWMAQNCQKLNARVIIGVGGTFDYIAGKHPKSPEFLHQMGLEWLWRLVTQPWRVKRMWNAIPVFVWKIYKYKQRMSS